MSDAGSSPTGDPLLDQLRKFEGAVAGNPRTADDPVNVPMIRHWCQAMGNTNPIFTDVRFARQSRFGDIVAPPTMLQAWTHHDRRFMPEQDKGDNAEDQLVGLLTQHGFESVVATNCDQEYTRYLRPGDHLTYNAVIESVSDQKQTGLGTGYFITTRVTYTCEDDEVVGTMLFRVLRYRPNS